MEPCIHCIGSVTLSTVPPGKSYTVVLYKCQRIGPVNEVFWEEKTDLNI